MKQMIRIIRKSDLEKEYAHLLRLELDYELLSLNSSIQKNDEPAIAKSKNRLKEIKADLDKLNVENRFCY